MEFQLQLQLKMEMEKVQRVGGVAIYCEILKLHKLRAARAWPAEKAAPPVPPSPAVPHKRAPSAGECFGSSDAPTKPLSPLNTPGNPCTWPTGWPALLCTNYENSARFAIAWLSFWPGCLAVWLLPAACWLLAVLARPPSCLVARVVKCCAELCCSNSSNMQRDSCLHPGELLETQGKTQRKAECGGGGGAPAKVKNIAASNKINIGFGFGFDSAPAESFTYRLAPSSPQRPEEARCVTVLLMSFKMCLACHNFTKVNA
uniref:HDC15749 n=1 Tax=Drosophila melanogaster TaxID=7227 RepID=Q6IJ73_DROME|nr:TPA_inf: HDC15749 [Drosophila melanogaster]